MMTHDGLILFSIYVLVVIFLSTRVLYRVASLPKSFTNFKCDRCPERYIGEARLIREQSRAPVPSEISVHPHLPFQSKFQTNDE